MARSRRDFMKTGTFAALAAGISATLSGSVSAKTVTSLLSVEDPLAKARFVRNLNTVFRVRAAGSTAMLKLTKVTDLPGVKRSNREGFSLIFDGAPAKILTQNVYTIDHDELGTLSLLMVPIVTRRRNQPQYEVVINKLHS